MNREAALGIGLATAGLVWGVHATLSPNAADIRQADPEDTTVAATERQATAISTGIVAGISLLAKDATVFIIGGATVLALAWAKRAANFYDPITGRTVAATGSVRMADGAATAPAGAAY